MYNRKARMCYKMVAGLMVMGLLTGCGAGKDNNTTNTETSESVPGGTQTSTTTDAEKSQKKFDENSKETRKKTAEIEGILDKYFYFDQDSEKRDEAYYDGLMKGLDDPYSVYYTPEEFKQKQISESGTFAGIGAVVSKSKEDNTIFIVEPKKDSGAEKAGLEAEDVIVQIDDFELTTETTLEEAVSKMRGEEGTVVHLKVYRESINDFIEVDITRAIYEEESVAYEMLEGTNIAYMDISNFAENTPDQFKEQLDEIEGKNVDGIIMDLRGNPGGSLKAVLIMLDYIIGDSELADNCQTPGLLVETKDKNDVVMDNYICSDGHAIDGIPMVVLVNGNSASASEIFAGCMQDYGRGTIVGEQTYGKGIVQNIIPLSDGSAIKITIAKYFLPSGRDIHTYGIEPDVKAEISEEHMKLKVLEVEDDDQLQAGIKVIEGE